jgi:molybdenum cofactor sulfurtransferase
LTPYMPLLPVRLSSLTHSLVNTLSRLRHDTTGKPVTKILSRRPKKRVRFVGDQADVGSTVSLLFLLVSGNSNVKTMTCSSLHQPTGEMLSNAFVEWAASKQRISLRTGCMCNPGAAAALLGITDDMRKLYPGVTLKDFECYVGRELGVVRISLGLASNFEDVWKVIRFASMMGIKDVRQALWKRWTDSIGVGVAI